MAANVDMQVVRDILEEELGPSKAAKVIFAALDEPDAEIDADAMLFVRGPMTRILEIERNDASLVIDRIAKALDPMGDITIDESAFEDATVMTRSLGGSDASGPLKVLVLARTKKLMTKLEVALGPENIGAATARDEQAMARLEGALTPDVVIVDGQSAADVAPPALAEALAGKLDRLILIWCADQPAGSAAKNALEARKIDFVAIPRSAGVDPLIDYLRARMSDE